MSRGEKQEQINKAINYFIQNDISITESTCNVFSTHLIENCTIRNYSITQFRNIYRFRVNNLDSITSILKYLYGDATVYLDRKYNLFKKICRCEK